MKEAIDFIAEIGLLVFLGMGFIALIDYLMTPKKRAQRQINNCGSPTEADFKKLDQDIEEGAKQAEELDRWYREEQEAQQELEKKIATIEDKWSRCGCGELLFKSGDQWFCPICDDNSIA